MEVTAKLKHARISPQKCRLVADQVRGKAVGNALATMRFMPKKGAEIILKVLQSAIANAENNHQLDVDRLYVKEAYVGKSMRMRRFRPRARGRVGRIEKPFSHLTVVVREREEQA